MKIAVILSSGMATRLYPITSCLPKCLVNYQQHTVLKHLHDMYKELGAEKIICVVHSDYAHLVRNYSKSIGLEVDVLCVDEALGSLYAVSMIGEFINGHNVILNWADIIPQFQTTDIWNKDAIYTYGNQCRFNYRKGEPLESHRTDGNVIGIYSAASLNLPDCYIHDVVKNWANGRDFVEYFVKTQPEQIDLSGAIDIGDFEKLRESHKGTTTEREFNKIIFEGTKVKKIPLNEQGAQLQQYELNWYRQSPQGAVRLISEQPMVISKAKGVPMHQAYNRTLLSRILFSLEMLGTNPIKVPNDVIEHSFKKEIVDKTISRTEKIQYLINHNGVKFVNGVRIGNLQQLLEQAYRHIIRNQLDKPWFLIHGDPNFSNMFYDGENVEFIDPRGYFADSKLYGPRFYDVCKVIYALSGYDKFNSQPDWAGLTLIRDLVEGSKANVEIEPLDPDWNNYQRFSDDHLLMVGVIWVALAGYFKNNPYKAISAYYYGMYLLTIMVKKMGRVLENGNISYTTERKATPKLISANPSKWLLTDLETGETYQPVEGSSSWAKL